MTDITDYGRFDFLHVNHVPEGLVVLAYLAQVSLDCAVGYAAANIDARPDIPMRSARWEIQFTLPDRDPVLIVRAFK